MRLYSAVLAILALLLVTPAHAAFDVGDIVCETTTTTGTGTVDLAGAVTNYLTFVSQIASGNTVPYHIRASDGKLETGVGTFTDATPDTLSRTADWSTDGSGAELTLPAGTHTVCLGPISGSMVHNPTVETIEMAADATYDIGTSTVGVNDIHLGSAGIINWDGSDVLWTHSANLIAQTGGAYVLGHSAQIALGDTSMMQILGNSDNTASFALVRSSNNTSSPRFNQGKSRGASAGDHGLVLDGDILGNQFFWGSDGTIFQNGAQIRVEVDGDPATAGDTTDMPSSIMLMTSADGSSTPAQGLRVAPNKGVVIGNGVTSPGAEDLSLEGGDLEFGNAGTAGTDTTLSYSAAGELTLEGDAVKHAGKQMMWIPAASMRNGVASPASCGDTYDSGASDISITVCAFDPGATEERAEFTVAMPKAWNESTVTFIPISTCAGACAATEILQYEVACGAVSSEDSVNVTLGTAQSSAKTLQATPTNESLVGAESSAITCGGTPAENDIVHFRISRDTSNDNMAGDALLIGVKLFWTDNASTLAE